MIAQKNRNINFSWQGVNTSGNKVQGIIEAHSIQIAKASLRKQGIAVSHITQKRESLFKKRQKKIKSLDITAFSRQLATMLSSGIPLVQSFDIVARGQKNPRMHDLIIEIKKNVEGGLTLAEAFKKHPEYFNPLVCNLVDAGEKSGSLDVMLDKIASYKERTETIIKKIKKALTYPVVVLCIAVIVTAALLIFVVPQFDSLFKGFGADLPAATKMVVKLSQFVQSYWYLMAAAIAAIIYGLMYGRKHSKKFNHRLDYFLLKMPLFGNIVEKGAIARFTRTLAITFAAGLPLVDALKAVSGATGNSLFAETTLRIRDEVAGGQTMRAAMEHTHFFPNMVVQMVAIGEESGSLEAMLNKVADIYEEDVNHAVDSLSTLIEPIVMSLLGILVGGLVIAMYLPIFKLGSIV